jgi:hypothetical protein
MGFPGLRRRIDELEAGERLRRWLMTRKSSSWRK